MTEQKADLDANEPATPHKLKKAHERGSIVSSPELTFAFVLLACVACVYGLGLQVGDGVALVIRRGLSFAARGELTQASALTYAGMLGERMLTVLAPTLFLVWLSALLIGALQARGVFTAEPLKPDFSRLNPVNGMKRVFSIRSLHDLLRSSAKMAVVGLSMIVWYRHHLNDLLSFPNRTPRSMQQEGIALLGSALTVLAGLVLLFALADFLFNRWEYMRQMRMSRREIRDEHKEREGDPRIRARLRELRVEWLKRMRQLSKIRSADVLLTNPTHYAVALEYRLGEMPAPMITARGAGEMALQMRKEARRRGVPIVEHPALTRALFAVRESQMFVPEEHFNQVARVLRWVFGARASGGRRSA